MNHNDEITALLSGENMGKEVSQSADNSERATRSFIAPLPWNARGPYIFSGKNCISICDTDNAPLKNLQANAAFIVRAVNSHDDLLAALKHALEAVAINEADIKPGLAIYLTDICRAAIAKAGSHS